MINTCGIAVGGITTNMLEYIKALSGQNLSFDIVATIYQEEAVIQKFKKLGCRIVRFPNRKKNTLQYIRKLEKLMQNQSYDVVHVHGNSSTMSLELYYAKKMGIKKRIAHCHNTLCLHPYINRMMMPVFNNTYTDGIACSALAGTWLFGAGNFQILHNAIDVDKFLYNEEIRNQYRKKLNIDENTVLLGHVGNMNEQKNHEFLLKLFTCFVKKKNADLVLLGDGLLRSNLQRLAQELDIYEHVHFLGIRDDVSCWMQAMDVFVFPSLWEGLPLVLMEAQAAGLPCLISNRITKEVDCSGIIVYQGLDDGPEAWALKLEQIIKEKMVRDAINAENVRISGYDIQRESRKLLDIYRKFNTS